MFNQVSGRELTPLPIVVISVINEDNILLINRKRRPYYNYWGLIGGKILMGETIRDASLRLVKYKSGISSKFVSYNSILHENVKEKNVLKHDFILFFTKVSTDEFNFKESEYGTLKWFKLNKIPNKIIPSDKWLIKNKLNSKLDIESFLINEKKDGKLI